MTYEDKLAAAKAVALDEGISSSEWRIWEMQMRRLLSRLGTTPERIHAMAEKYWRGL